MVDKKRIQIFGTIYFILGILSLPLVLIATISGSYNLKSPLEVLLEIMMRILFVGTSAGLLVSAVGLLNFKEWGRICAIAVSIILSAACISYGISGLGQRGNDLFVAICFALAIFFIVATVSLTESRQHFI